MSRATDTMKLDETVSLDNGKKERFFRGRFPFSGLPIKPSSVSRSEHSSEEEVNESSELLISGVASSTSVDHYGTEMSRTALDSMSDQMQKGLPILPRHNNGNRAVEWDEVIGRTVRAKVVKSDVVQAANDSEQGYTLVLDSVLYRDEPLAKELSRRLSRGEPIGQSIGGWFLNVRVLEDSDGNVERMVVEQVDLDHIAITRAPANPDSYNLALRSMIEGAIKTEDERHIVSVEEKEDSFVVEFAKHHEGEMEEESYHDDEKSKHDDEEEMAKHEEEMAGHEEEEKEMVEDGPEDTRGAVEFADLPLAPIDTEWDWSTEASNLVLGDDDWDRYKRAHVWFDPENAETKAGYKLPIALFIDDRLHAVWRGVSAALAALNGARGGVDIPEEDRQSVYDHLVKYYEKFDKQVPPLKELSIIDSSNSLVGLAQVSETCNTWDDAEKGAPNNTPTEDQSMTKDDLDAIRSMIEASVGGIAARLDAVENRTSVDNAPTATSDDTEIQQLRTQLEAAQKQIQTLASRPVRVGRATMPYAPEGKAGVTALAGLAERAKTDAPTVAATVVQNSGESLDQTTDRSTLIRMLTDVLCAAEYDGFLGNQNIAPRWG